MNPLTRITRRTFLRTSATAASATALGVGCQTQPKPAAPTTAAATLAAVTPVHAAGSDIIKVGIIGCGERNGGAGFQALSADKGTHLVAMCDIFRDRVVATREAIRTEMAKTNEQDRVQVKDDACYTGLDAYRQVIADSDVVLIANAAKFHPRQLMSAIQAGKHVFVEKPHGIDPEGIHLVRTACALAKEKRLCVVSGLHSRHHAGYAETVQRIHDGAIGEVIAIEENFLRAPYRVFHRKPEQTELLYQLSNQYHFTWLSGDDVVQSLVHNLDRAIWVMQGEHPEKCHGLGGRSSMTGEEYGNVFDHHSVIYELASGTRIYAFCRTTTGCYDESSSIVLGSKGRASITRCEIRGDTNWRWRGNSNPYQIEHDKLFAAIRAGQPINNGDYMADSTLAGVMGQISCYTGKEVTWEQALASEFGYPPKPEACHDGMTPPTQPGPNGSYPVYIPGQTKLI